MAPTVMVARVALASNRSGDEPNTAHISDLNFQRETSGVVTSWDGSDSAEACAVHVDSEKPSVDPNENRM